MKQPNDRNTKAEILSAYKELFKKYEALSSKNKTAKQLILEENNNELIEKVETTNRESVYEAAEAFVNSAKALEEKIVSDGIAYSELNEAIALKQKELSELFGIEKEAYNLVALKEAQKIEKEEFDAEMVKKKNDVDIELAETEQAIKQMIQDAEKERKQKREDFEYDFQREKKQKKDQLEDMTLQYNKDWERKSLEIEKEKESVETAKENLEKMAESFEAEKDSFHAKYRKDAAIEVNCVKREYENKIEILKNKYESEIDKLQYQISLLSEQRNNLESDCINLENKLEKAYEKLQELAKETVQSKGKDDFIKELGSIAKTSHQGK